MLKWLALCVLSAALPSSLLHIWMGADRPDPSPMFLDVDVCTQGGKQQQDVIHNHTQFAISPMQLQAFTVDIPPNTLFTYPSIRSKNAPQGFGCARNNTHANLTNYEALPNFLTQALLFYEPINQFCQVMQWLHD